MPSCTLCGEPVGAWEPAVFVGAGRAPTSARPNRTSRTPSQALSYSMRPATTIRSFPRKRCAGDRMERRNPTRTVRIHGCDFQPQPPRAIIHVWVVQITVANFIVILLMFIAFAPRSSAVPAQT